MKDRQVQHPNRFLLTGVSGQDGVYDITPEPGTVTEAGTALNKANLLSDATAGLLDLSGDPTVDDAFAAVAGEFSALRYPTWTRLGSYTASAAVTGSITLSLSDYLDNYLEIYVYLYWGKSESTSKQIEIHLGDSTDGDLYARSSRGSASTFSGDGLQRRIYKADDTYANLLPIEFNYSSSGGTEAVARSVINDWHYNKMYFYNVGSATIRAGSEVEVFGLR